jgi:hypothetical protein
MEKYRTGKTLPAKKRQKPFPQQILSGTGARKVSF